MTVRNRLLNVYIYTIVICIAMLELNCKSIYLWKLLLFFKTCKIQELMEIISASKWASHSNKSSPKIITSETRKKNYHFWDDPCYLCIPLNNDLLVSLCYMEQERVTAQTLSDSLSYWPLGPKLSPRYLPSLNLNATKLRRNYHSAIFFLVGMAAKADNEEVMNIHEIRV